MFIEWCYERESGRQMSELTRCNRNTAQCSRVIDCRRNVPVDAGVAGDLNEVAVFEIECQKARTPLLLNVAERVVELVAGVIRHPDRTIGQYLDAEALN